MLWTLPFRSQVPSLYAATKMAVQGSLFLICVQRPPGLGGGLGGGLFPASSLLLSEDSSGLGIGLSDGYVSIKWL